MRNKAYEVGTIRRLQVEKGLVNVHPKCYIEIQTLAIEGEVALSTYPNAIASAVPTCIRGVVIIHIIHRFANQSIRFKLIIGFLVFVIPLLSLLLFNNNYAIHVVRDQVANSNENLTTLYMDQIDRNLEEVDKYLRITAAFESDLLPLGIAEEEDRDQYNFAKINLFNKLEKDVANYKSIDLLFAYSAVNEDLITNHPPEMTSEQLKKIKKGITAQLQDKQKLNDYRSGKWFAHNINGQYYLTNVKSIGNVYIGGWVEASKLMVPLSLLELGQDGRAILITDNMEPMNDDNFFEENHIDPDAERGRSALLGKQGKYLQVSKQSGQGNFSLLILIPYSTILERLPDLQRVSSLVLVGLLAMLPFFYIFLRHIILLPMNRIVMVMRRVRDGNLEHRVEKHPVSYEFALMNDVFNSMVDQIKQLKINVYEEQLLSQRAELKHLQLQINPHFFLNSLNTIYNLAQFKNYQLIQEMSSYLIQYMRFMFQSNMKFVSLEDELAHTRNYLHIQAMRFHEGFTYDIDSPPSAANAKVPPLIIQTFVENTVKHAITMDEPIRLSIEIEVAGAEADKPFLNIVITDTGNGFPDDILRDLQLDNAIDTEGREHIGIWNARRRLRLLYEGEAKLMLSNQAAGGAKIAMRLPLLFEE
ncbi:HAMP domain-containing protein [Paenibacillaceae bacterium]|nr:HAMP domain-containing protein [Paenibacillaceae bacterium]